MKTATDKVLRQLSEAQLQQEIAGPVASLSWFLISGLFVIVAPVLGFAWVLP